MRFIVREQDSERLLAAGLFRYEAVNGLTGVTESWRLTDVMEEYRVLRVDIDSRESVRGDSLLYHLVMNRENRPERLKVRFFGPDLNGWADLVFGVTSVTLTQLFNDHRTENELSTTEWSSFYLYSAAWSGFIIQSLLTQGDRTGIILTRADQFLLQSTSMKLECNDTAYLDIGSKRIKVKHCQLRMSDRILRYWVDDYGLAIKTEDNLGQRAMETQYIRHAKSVLGSAAHDL